MGVDEACGAEAEKEVLRAEMLRASLIFPR